MHTVGSTTKHMSHYDRVVTISDTHSLSNIKKVETDMATTNAGMNSQDTLREGKTVSQPSEHRE